MPSTDAWPVPGNCDEGRLESGEGVDAAARRRELVVETVVAAVELLLRSAPILQQLPGTGQASVLGIE